MLRVLHLTSSFPRHEGDHQAPFMAELVAAQRAGGLDPFVLAPHGPGMRRFDLVSWVPVWRFRYGPAAAEILAYRGGITEAVRHPAGAAALGPFLASFSAAAARLARKERMDVVHAHWWLPAGLAGVVAAAVAGIPLVVTCHGSDVELARTSPSARRAARAVLSRATLVAAVSGPLAAEVEAVTGVRAEVLRMPFALPADEPPTPALPPDPPIRLLAVGRLSPEKGFDVALAAVTRLVAEGCDVRLRIIGDGPRRAELLAAAAAIPDGRAQLTGPATTAELAEAFSRCHALVVPSRHEGLGLAAVEARARGRPVIASRVGGLVEVVEGPEDGILVPPDDPAALAAAIRRLPLAVTPGGAVLARHVPAQVAEDHRLAYQEARSRRPARRPAPPWERWP